MPNRPDDPERSPNLKRMDIAEFRRLGYLQEVNRLFFHPLGLALEVQIDQGGNELLGGIWDCREDPEGIYFAGPGAPHREKASYVHEERERRAAPRTAALGYVIQPIAAGVPGQEI